MKVILKHDIYPVKNGYAAHSPEMRVTAHGHSPEIAKRIFKERRLCLCSHSGEREALLMP